MTQYYSRVNLIVACVDLTGMPGVYLLVTNSTIPRALLPDPSRAIIMIHMIQRTLQHVQLIITRFHWRVMLSVTCTTWLVMYQITTWHEQRVRAQAFEQQIAHSGVPPIQVLRPGPVNAAVVQAPPVMDPTCFSSPHEYFEYWNTRARVPLHTGPGRTR